MVQQAFKHLYVDTPTSVIPVSTGVLCQSINPMGITSDTGTPFMAKPITQNGVNRNGNTHNRRTLNARIEEIPAMASEEEYAKCQWRERLSSGSPGRVEPLDSRLRVPYTTATTCVSRHKHSSVRSSDQSGDSLPHPPAILDPSKLSNSVLSSIKSSAASTENVPTELPVHSSTSDVPTISGAISYGSMSHSNPNSSRTNSRIQRMAERVNENRKCRLCLWLFAVICALNVVFFLFAYDNVVHTVAVGQLALSDSGVKYEAWSKTSVPVYYKVTIFNLTNPEAFMEGDRPRVQEIGPYTYRMTDEKVDVKFHDNGTVTYRSKPTYFYEPDLSVGSEDDQLWTVNIPFVNAADAVKDHPFLKMIINYAREIHNFETIQHLTVRELLWGHPSNVLDWGRMFTEVPYPHMNFGLLVGFNNTPQETYTMYTGADDPDKMNSIHSWNGRTKLDFWSGDSCNRIYGTDAGGFSPGVSRTDVLHIFNGQLCRSIPLVYQRTVRQAGIEAYRFVPPGDIFSYGVSNPENSCFCTGGQCPPEGVLDMKPCYWGAAIAFSFPHFHRADPTLRHMVQGLRPDPKKHSTEFDIFPDLGIPLRVKLRMQMNVVLDRNQALNRARHFDLIYPVFWFEAGIDSLPTNLVSKLQMAQDLPPLMKKVFLVFCGVLSVLFLVLLMAQTILALCRSGLSSLRGGGSSRGSGSNQDTRSTTPDLDGDIGGSRSKEDISAAAPAEGDVRVPMSGAYRSFDLPQITQDDGIVKIADNHTLLPPYRNNGTNGRVAGHNGRVAATTSTNTNKNRLAGVNSYVGDYISRELDELNNEYPPDYLSVTRNQVQGSSNPRVSEDTKGADTDSCRSSKASSVSVDVEVHHPASYVDARNPTWSIPRHDSDSSAPLKQHTNERPIVRPNRNQQDDFRDIQLEHKPLAQSLTAPTIVSEIPKSNRTKSAVPATLEVAPLASPEDDDLPATPSDLILQQQPQSVNFPQDSNNLRQEPLATSSPQETQEDIQWTQGGNLASVALPLPSRPENAEGKHSIRETPNARRYLSRTLPSYRSSYSSAMNTSLPPLESDL